MEEGKTREQIRAEVAALDKKYIMLAMPTGLGKTYTALAATYKEPTLIPLNVLIVYPKIVIKDSWVEDMEKWGFQDKLPGVTFTTYNSLHKHADKVWDMVIFDEGHHITERVLEVIEVMKYKRALVLSATIKKTLKYQLSMIMPSLYVYRVSMREAIDNEILPEPRIYLLPLKYDVLKKTQEIVKNPKITAPVKEIPFEHKDYYKDKKCRYIIKCTEAQRALDWDKEVAWYKKKADENPALKNLWLHKAGDRLKWLALLKTKLVSELLKKLDKERTLTFCASIKQTEELGKNCIHSKNKSANTIKKAFNEGSIDHITACAMLDEGVNLSNCRIGIFANLNSGERLQVQRVGRILRHSDPIIILPYYEHSREEEIVCDMLASYNPEKTTKINSIDEIKL